MKISDLWIGDRVQLLHSKRIGTYEGTNNTGKLRIKVEGKIILTNSQNIKLIQDEYDNLIEELEFPEQKPPYKESTTKLSSIDLHMEFLDPEMRVPAIRALDFQIEKCKAFIEAAIQHKKHSITIIHGKGTGTLKSAVNHLLLDYSEFYLKLEVHNGGATEVWFSY
jgi:dsDNA-specific endonuclease/ATPase MutS2